MVVQWWDKNPLSNPPKYKRFFRFLFDPYTPFFFFSLLPLSLFRYHLGSTTAATMEASAPQPDGSELASKLVSLLSISVMSILFGIKTFNVQFKYLTYSRWLVLTLYIISWGFTCAATLFVSTNNQNLLSCFLSEMACDIFYSATKIIIYGWYVSPNIHDS